MGLREFKPSPSLVVAIIALFCAVGGTAFAASKIDSSDVKNNSLKSVDLKDGAGVKGADVKDGSLRGGAVGDGSVSGAQVADDSITGADIDESSLSASHLVQRLGGPSGIALTGATTTTALPNGAYTQAADSTDTYIAGGEVTFAASCTQPRSVNGFLLIDGLTPTPQDVAGQVSVSDTGTGAVTKHFTVNGNALAGTAGMSQFRPGTPTNHQFVLTLGGNCSSGSGVTLDSVGVDVTSNR